MAIANRPRRRYHYLMEKGVIYYAAYRPGVAGVGPVLVAKSGGAIVELSLTGTIEACAEGLARRHGAEVRLVEDPARFAQLFAALDRYFDGRPERFEGIRLAPLGTEFQRRIWDALTKIPWGGVVSYKELASMVGSPGAARAAGGACGANPIPLVIPCHRVLGAGGSIGGYSGGKGIKKILLEIEGHVVSPSGMVGGVVEAGAGGLG